MLNPISTIHLKKKNNILQHSYCAIDRSQYMNHLPLISHGTLHMSALEFKQLYARQRPDRLKCHFMQFIQYDAVIKPSNLSKRLTIDNLKVALV